MFDTLITILVSLLAFGFLIFIHEFGHFITARIFGVTVTEFSIGMGPKLMWYDSKKSGTRYSLAMLPIGGFVAMAGEDGESDDPNAFNKKPAWQRFIITAAGAFVNIVFGFLAMFLIVGMIKIGGTTVGRFSTNEEMLEMGESVDLTDRTSSVLKVGDVILSVEGKKVYIADELSYEIMRHGDKPVDLVIERDGVVMELNDVSFPKVTDQGQVFGVLDFRVYEKEKTFGNFFSISFRKTGLVLRMCWESIFDLITGRYSFAAVSGPVGISGAIGDAFSAGFLSLLNIIVIISINLGFMNLLPIPALDGGRLIVLFVEMVFRKKLPERVEAMINTVGLAILLGLSVLIMVKDIFTLF
ncbi:MAG: site-2 protease family protein [Clostridia bacterium]|nr:site-2 protease family protein [Clostridia bacterium]